MFSIIIFSSHLSKKTGIIVSEIILRLLRELFIYLDISLDACLAICSFRCLIFQIRTSRARLMIKPPVMTIDISEIPTSVISIFVHRLFVYFFLFPFTNYFFGKTGN
jgi:hypothetical protein